MTEDEAKTKWCPMVRNLAIGSTENISTGINRYNPRQPEEITGATCIGSNCMMWRWKKILMKVPVDAARFGFTEESKTDGHCGLAGKS